MRHGALIISVDFELLWGLRDHYSANSNYAVKNILGERVAIPKLLDTFDRYGLRTTWAVVGLACLGGIVERQTFDPVLKPAYRDANLSPYSHRTGTCEGDDLLHFGKSLVSNVMSRGAHEIASHTYSHYYCCEPGCDPGSFEADCKAFSALSEWLGFRARSIVFPRNQMNLAFERVLLSEGIDTYRGNPTHWAYSPLAFSRQGIFRRATRLVDSLFPVGGDHTYAWDEVPQLSGMKNVRASFFLRPWSAANSLFSLARISRIKRAMSYAAERGRLLHLWFHPHNFGLNTSENIAGLSMLLDHFVVLRERFGMRSLSMGDVSEALVMGGVR